MRAAARKSRSFAREVDENAFLAKAGNGINQQLVGAKLRWIERHEPDIFARIGTVFGSYDYINWRLTGERAIEQNWALEAGFVDLATHAIDDALVALARIPRSALPRKVASHEILGIVSDQGARESGLKFGTPVIGARRTTSHPRLARASSAPATSSSSSAARSTF